MLSPQEIQSYRDKYKINPTEAPTPAKQGYLERVKQTFSSGVDLARKSADEYYDPAKTKTLGGGIKAGSGLFAGSTRAIASPILEAPIIKQIGEGFSKAGEFVEKKVLGGLPSDALSKLPEGVLETTSNVAEGAMNVAALQGTAKTISNLPRTVSKIDQQIRPIVSTTGKIIKEGGRKAYSTTITPQETTAKMTMAYDAQQPSLIGRIKNFVKGESVGEKPITEADTAARHGLFGTEYQVGVQAKQVGTRIWNEVVKPRLDSIKGQVNMKSFLEQVEKEINNTKDLTRRGVLREALDVIKEDYKKVRGIRLSKLQEYKEGWAEFVPEGSYKGKPIGSAVKEIHSLMAEKARGIIYKYGGKDIQQAYIDYGNLKSIEKAGLKSTLGEPQSKSFSRGVWEFVMNKAVTPVATIAGKVLYRTGEGLEFIGEPGAKTVGDVVGKRNMLVTQKSGERNVPITRPTQLKVKQEGKGTNKVPLYGGQTAPRPDSSLPTID